DPEPRLAAGWRRSGRSRSARSLNRFANHLRPLVRNRGIAINPLAISVQVPGVSGRREVTALRCFDPPFSGVRVALPHAPAIGIQHGHGRLGRDVALLRGFQRRLESAGEIYLGWLAGPQVIAHQGGPAHTEKIYRLLGPAISADFVILQIAHLQNGNLFQPLLPTAVRRSSPLSARAGRFVKRRQNAGGRGTDGLLLLLEQRD